MQGNPFRILVVDDDPDMLRLLQRFFTPLHCETIMATNFDEASAAVEEHSFDLAFVDGNLGDGYGLKGSAARVIQTLLKPNNVRYINFSAEVPAIPEELIDLGALRKPQGMHTLREIVNRVRSGSDVGGLIRGLNG